jgi:hypothetical protein
VRILVELELRFMRRGIIGRYKPLEVIGSEEIRGTHYGVCCFMECCIRHSYDVSRGCRILS